MALATTQPGWLALAVVAHVLILPLWVVQWQGLAQPFRVVPVLSMTEAVALSIGSKVALSGAVGVAGGFYGLTARAGLAPAAASVVIAADQLVAALMKLGLLAIVGPLVAVPLLPQGVILPLLAVVAAGLALFFGMAAGRRLSRKVARALPDLKQLGSLRVFGLAVTLGVLKKSTEIAAALCVQMACGLHVGLGGAALAVVAVSLSTVLPVMPANLGTHSAAVAGAYVLLGAPAAQAVSVGLLHHASLLAASAMIAAGVTMWSRWRAGSGTGTA